MDTDYSGLDNIVKVIQHSNLSKYIIHRPNYAKNSSPVHECITTNSNTAAIANFKKWAELVKNNNVYEMLLFSNYETATNPHEQQKGKKAKLIRFSFSLQGEYNHLPVHQPAMNQSELVESIYARLKKDQEESQVVKMIEALNLRIDAISGTDDEDDEEEEDNNTSSLEHLNKLADKAIYFIEKLNLFPTKPSAVMNGVTKFNESEKDRLLAACETMLIQDSDIVNSIEKLAVMSQKEPATFKFLLTQLKEK